MESQLRGLLASLVPKWCLMLLRHAAGKHGMFDKRMAVTTLLKTCFGMRAWQRVDVVKIS